MKLNASLLIFILTFIILAPAEARSGEVAYTVVRGDTLSLIARKFYGEPGQWKKIWNKNPHIKNPDLIYPGDKLTIPGKEAGETNEKELQPKSEAKKEAEKEETEIICAYDSMTNSIGFASVGYVLTGARQKILLSYGDYVFLDIGKAKGLKPFTIFSVWRPGKYITPPDSTVPVAVIMKKVGELKVSRDIGENTSTARIIESREPLEPGDLIKEKGMGTEEPLPSGGEWIKELFIAPWRPERATFEFGFDGYVSEFRDTRNIAGYNEKVYLDLGRNFYAELGKVYIVYRKGRTVLHPRTGQLIGVPVERIGFLQIIPGPKGRNTAIIKECKRPVLIGDMVKELKVGKKEDSSFPWE